MNLSERLFSLEHIRDCAFHASFTLTEQAIHCLELVRELSEEKLVFQFKGGNSLLLILETPARFSIDVDIATDQPAGAIEEVLSRCAGTFGKFTRWEKRQHKTKPWIPLSSYYLYYQSVVPDVGETSIMLDAQMHRSPYPCCRKEITCGQLYESTVTAELPLPSGIVGDKLLTLGPSTLGIPVGKGKAAQRLKHVFDIARLCGMRPNLDGIRGSFINCLDFECSLQKRTLSVDEVIIDTVKSLAGAIVLAAPTGQCEPGTILAEHIEGRLPFASHLFSGAYSWHDLRLDMARVAFCITSVGDAAITDQLFETVVASDSIRQGLAGTDDDKQRWTSDLWRRVAAGKYGAAGLVQG